LRHDRATVRHRLFIIGISIKGLDGLVELIGGGALLLTTRPEILRVVTMLTRSELIEDPGDFVANHLLQLARHLSLGVQEFAGIYLVAQGLVKVVLVVGLLRGRRWAYPLAVTLMSAFIGYQGYRLWQSPAIGFMALTLFDVIIVGLIAREWRDHTAIAMPQ